MTVQFCRCITILVNTLEEFVFTAACHCSPAPIVTGWETPIEVVMAMGRFVVLSGHQPPEHMNFVLPLPSCMQLSKVRFRFHLSPQTPSHRSASCDSYCNVFSCALQVSAACLHTCNLSCLEALLQTQSSWPPRLQPPNAWQPPNLASSFPTASTSLPSSHESSFLA